MPNVERITDLPVSRDEVTRLTRARNAWRELAEARGKLLESYRLGKAPSEATWAKIDHAREELDTLGEYPGFEAQAAGASLAAPAPSTPSRRSGP